MGPRTQESLAAQSPQVVQLLGMIVTQCDAVDETCMRRAAPSGILVLGARRESAAVRGGVVTGDIICEVNGVTVSTLEELESCLTEHDPSLPVRLLIRSGEIWRFLAVPLRESWNVDHREPFLQLSMMRLRD